MVNLISSDTKHAVVDWCEQYPRSFEQTLLLQLQKSYDIDDWYATFDFAYSADDDFTVQTESMSGCQASD